MQRPGASGKNRSAHPTPPHLPQAVGVLRAADEGHPSPLDTPLPIQKSPLKDRCVQCIIRTGYHENLFNIPAGQDLLDRLRVVHFRTSLDRHQRHLVGYVVSGGLDREHQHFFAGIFRVGQGRDTVQFTLGGRTGTGACARRQDERKNG